MELFKLFGTIALDNAEAIQGIDETAGKAGQITAVFEKVGAAAATAGKAMAAGLAAGTAAVGALAKSSLDSYASYEQLAGGVETLFNESGDTVKAYAQNAYSSAGMSANEYMETVTSFSASLLQGLNGDTAKAAEIANRAIVDMSDNANKMGTDMSMIQNAYQGFAKQNYTMLDNLKLGYGGTQAEMARLINDSGVLGQSIKVTAETVNNVSFDKIIEAIGVVQDRMGITGTTAKEASETISGSLASTKAAWQNLLTGFADGSQDLNSLINNLVGCVETAAKNIVPRVTEILSGISDALPQIIAVVSAELPGLVGSLLPGLISGAVALVSGLAQMVPSLVQMIFSDLPYHLSAALEASTNPVISQLGYVFLSVGEFWREIIAPAIGEVGAAFGSLLGAVQPVIAVFPSLLAEATGITNGFDILRAVCFAVEDALMFVADKVGEVARWITEHSAQIRNALGGIVAWISANSGLIADIVVVIGSFAAAWAVVTGAVSVATAAAGALGTAIAFLTSPVTLVIAAIGALIAAIALCVKHWDTIKETAIEVWDNITTAVSGAVENIRNAISEKFEAAGQIIADIFTSICDFVSGAWDTITNIVEVGVQLIGSILSAAFTIITLPFQFIWENCKDYVQTTWNNIQGIISKALSAIQQAVTKAWSTISKNLSSTLKQISSAVSQAWNTIKSNVTTALNNIKSAVSTGWNIIKSVTTSAMNSVKNVVSNAWNNIKSVVSSAMGSVKAAISSGMSSAQSTISGVLGSIESGFSSAFASAKSIVRSAINSIKNMFNFSWSLPQLKLPHFSIVGEFSLDPPSVPKLSVEWYKKAMDNPLLMTSPTIFGYDAASGRFQAGGEAGPEVVSGAHTLMNMIGDVVDSKMAAQNERIISLLTALLNATAEGNKEMVNALLAGQVIKLNERELARTVRGYA